MTGDGCDNYGHPMTPLLLSAHEAAESLGISVRTLDRYVTKGLLTPVRLPGGQRRFDSTEVARLVQK